MSQIDNIKNKINQIRNSEIKITNEFPSKDNFSKNSYRKCWVNCLFVDIVKYTEICKSNKDEKIGKMLRTFHEGILDIMNHFKLKHIQIQGDGIFGILPNINSNDIFLCAKEIEKFLSCIWKEAGFRISIASGEELMIVVGENTGVESREVVFAGGVVNKAKNQMKDAKENCILIDQVFKEKNKNLTYDSCIEQVVFVYEETDEDVSNDW